VAPQTYENIIQIKNPMSRKTTILAKGHWEPIISKGTYINTLSIICVTYKKTIKIKIIIRFPNAFSLLINLIIRRKRQFSPKQIQRLKASIINGAKVRRIDC